MPSLGVLLIQPRSSSASQPFRSFHDALPLITLLTCFLYQSLKLRLQQHFSSCLLLATRAVLANNGNGMRRVRAAACEVVSWPLWCSSFSSADRRTFHFKNSNFSLTFLQEVVRWLVWEGEVLILRMNLLGIPRLVDQFLIVLFSSLGLSFRRKSSWAAVESLDLLRKGSGPFWPLFGIYAFKLRRDC